jgi:diguanylate cyclase (GGDEF)-like protein
MKLLTRIAVALLGILFTSQVVFGQAQARPTAAPTVPGQGVRFERLAVEDGLPNSTVLSVLQDKQGFMWFATADGLSRYDGYTFTTFRHDAENPNSLSNNNTFALIESSDGLIWVGTDPGGLNVYDPATGKFRFYHHSDDDPESLADDSVWSLLEASDGSIWVGTRGGLSRLDRESGKFKNYLVDPENPRALAGAVVYRIYQDRAGTIWVGTRNGLNRYDSQSDDFTVFKNQAEDPQSLSSSNVWAMLEDSQGVFWVGTRGGGLNRFDRATGKASAYKNTFGNPASLSNNNIWNIYEDRDGNLWVATENGGLNLFNRQNESFTSFQHNPNDPSSISNNDIYWLIQDRSGVLWITSRYGGVNKLYPALWRFGLYRGVPGDANTLNANSVYSILSEEDGILWIGTFGGGINRFDRNTRTMTVYRNDPNDVDSLSSDKIQRLYRDEKGELWISTSGGGLNRMDAQTGKFRAYRYSAETPDVIGSNFVTAIAPAGPDRLWVGTLGYGLDLFNTVSGKMEKEFAHDEDNPNSLTEDTVYDLAVEQSGRVWIATARGGLELLDPASGTFTHHLNDPADSNSILGNAVYSIYLDEKAGIIWAGTASGLSGLEIASGKWRNYTSRDGLPSDTIMGVQPGQDNDLWVSTGKGLSHFSIFANTFTNYDARDGLQGDQFEISSSARGPDGELFFGGSNGLTAFHPRDITPNEYLPPVVFTDFQLFNQTVPAGSEILPSPIEKTSQITLAYDQSVFTLKFAALNYQLSSKNHYQYKMEGFDKEWSPAGSKQEVTYTNLPPGSYTFMVRAANNDGVWNETAAQIMVIKVLPPWWQTWWFRVLAVVGGLLAILGVVNLRLRSIRGMNRALEQRVVERTQELEIAQTDLHRANLELKIQLEEISALEKTMREMAIHDALTGLYNRHHLSDRLRAEFARADRESHQIAFLLMDIDNFKTVNDTFGHLNGDLVLAEVGKILTSQTRLSDIACRYGGEEFMLVIPKIDTQSALERAEYFRKSVEDLRLMDNGSEIHITLSIGVAIFPLHVGIPEQVGVPLPGNVQDRMLTCADQALYQAKHAGRNRVVLYTPEAENLDAASQSRTD